MIHQSIEGLTLQEKGKVMDLLEFILEVIEDKEGAMYDDDDIVDYITEPKNEKPLKEIIEKLYEMGWAEDRRHDVVTGLPFNE